MFARPTTAELRGFGNPGSFGGLNGFNEDQALLKSQGGNMDEIFAAYAAQALSIANANKNFPLVQEISNYLAGSLPPSKAVQSAILNAVGQIADAYTRGNIENIIYGVFARYAGTAAPPTSTSNTPPVTSTTGTAAQVAQTGMTLTSGLLDIFGQKPAPTQADVNAAAAAGNPALAAQLAAAKKDNTTTYTILGLVAVAALGGALIYIRRKRARLAAGRGGNVIPIRAVAGLRRKLYGRKSRRSRRY